MGTSSLYMGLAIKVQEPCWKCTQSPRTEAQGNPVANENHQLLIEPTDQGTLQGLARLDPSILGDTKGRIGILAHGPSHQGPRTLLITHTAL